MWMKKNWKCVAIGTTSIGLLYLAYTLWKRIDSTPKKTDRKSSECSIDDQRLRTVHSNYSQFYFDKTQQLQQILGLISEKGPTPEEIYLLSPAIIVDQYLKYTRQIRKRRRLIRTINQDRYISLIRCYQIEVRELMERGRLQVLEEFGLTVDDLVKMQSVYEMFQDLQDLRKKAINQLKKKAWTSQKLRHIPRQKLRKIMQQQISFIGNKLYQRIKLKLQDDETISQQQIFKVVNTLCDDIIYQKYGYEREQIEKQLDDIPLIARDLKKQRQALFANLVQFNIQSLQSLDDDQSVQSEPRGVSKKTSKTYISDDFSNQAN